MIYFVPFKFPSTIVQILPRLIKILQKPSFSLGRLKPWPKHMHDQYNKARNSTKDQGNNLWHLQTTRESPSELLQVVKQKRMVLRCTSYSISHMQTNMTYRMLDLNLKNPIWVHNYLIHAQLRQWNHYSKWHYTWWIRITKILKHQYLNPNTFSSFCFYFSSNVRSRKRIPKTPQPRVSKTPIIKHHTHNPLLHSTHQ